MAWYHHVEMLQTVMLRMEESDPKIELCYDILYHLMEHNQEPGKTVKLKDEFINYQDNTAETLRRTVIALKEGVNTDTVYQQVWDHLIGINAVPDESRKVF